MQIKMRQSGVLPPFRGRQSAVLYAKNGSVLAKGSSQITDGAFNISLDTSDAAGYGCTLEISDGMETRTINNVAVGELWLLFRDRAICGSP